MIGSKRLTNLQTAEESVLEASVPGHLIETGAGRGGAALRGCRRAVDDFRQRLGATERRERIDYPGVFWRKAGGIA